MKVVEGVTEYISTEEAAKKLGIQISTLRKYAGMIDKKSKGGIYFGRDDKNYRLYTEDNIVTINQVIALKSRPKMTIESAIEQIINMEYSVDTTTETKKHSSDNSDITELQELMINQKVLIKQKDEQLLRYDNQMIKYEEAINRYEALVNDLTESNTILAGQLETMIKNQKQIALEQKEEEQRLLAAKIHEKKGFFSRFYK